MSIFSRLFKKAIDNAVGRFVKNKIYEAFYGLGFKYTQYDNDNKTYVDKGYNSNSDVYAVVSQKTTEVQRVPFLVKRVKDESVKERYFQFMNMVKNIVSPVTMMKKLSYEQKAFHNDELPMPLERPNEHQTWREFFGLYETYMDLTGNFYMYCLSPEMGANEGVPKEIYILPAHLTQIVLKSNVGFMESESPVDYYIIVEGSKYIRFEADKVIHIKYPNPNFDSQTGSHLYGQSPLRASLTNIQSSNSASKLNARTLANGGSFGFISGKEPLKQEQAEGLKDRLIEMDNSEERLSNIAGASKEVVFTRISLTTEELRPFDYLEHDQKAICNVLHWDDKLLNNDDGAKYDNRKIATRDAITKGISPNFRLFEEAFNRKLLPKFKGYDRSVFMWDESQLPEMQEDMEKLSKWLNAALDRGVINRDEYRAAINYSEIGTPEMKTHTVGMNIVALEDAVGEQEPLRFDE